MKFVFGLVVGFVSFYSFGQICQLPSGTGIGSEGCRGINLVVTGGAVPATTLMLGVNQWNNCSDQYVPEFTLNASHTQGAQLTINIVNGSDPSPNHALGSWNNQTGLITLYTHDRRGDALSAEQLGYALAHELGHVLGLADSSCGVMNSTYTASAPRVSPGDCSYVSSGWRDWFINCQKFFQLVFNVISPISRI